MDSGRPSSVGLTDSDCERIQRFATQHGVVVNVVGSRAAAEATTESDYDYILGDHGGTSRQRQKARRELPRGNAGGEIHPTLGETGIDVFKAELDLSRPHVTFAPAPKGRPK